MSTHLDTMELCLMCESTPNGVCLDCTIDYFGTLLGVIFDPSTDQTTRALAEEALASLAKGAL